MAHKKCRYIEGLDIWNKNMTEEVPISEDSSIAQMFEGRTVFITGATGFLGKLTLEKIARACTGVKKIYIIIREKKGKDIATRKKEMFSNEIFGPLKRKFPKFEDKVDVLYGDLTKPNLGIGEDDLKRLIMEVDFVFHIAATVRFNEHLKNAVRINIEATRDMLNLAKKMHHLKGFVHVSTAFSYCPRREIKEEIYDVPIAPHKLIALVNALDDDTLTSITPTILGKWPNTYAFTKAVAEELVKNESMNLPVTVVRPAIVLSTYKEPLSGWIGNFYGPTGVALGATLGLIRTMMLSKNKVADLVPADYVVNCIIASAWDVALHKEAFDYEKTNNEKFRIYNYVSSIQNPITWGKYVDSGVENASKIPSELCLWYYIFIRTSNPYYYTLLQFLLHTVPAHLVDVVRKVFGKKPILVKVYKKIHTQLEVIAYFTRQEWNISNKNTRELWKKLNPTDRKLFPFDMTEFDWDEYMVTYATGARVYLLKDPIETVDKGLRWYKKLFAIHYCTLAILTLVPLKIIQLLCNFIMAHIY